MRRYGYDIVITKPNAKEALACTVCGAAMSVERNLPAWHGFASAMAGRASVHDAWTCPNSGEEWHDKARDLVQAIEQEPSQRVAALRREDLAELLELHMGKQR